jgi:hypothetical protein
MCRSAYSPQCVRPMPVPTPAATQGPGGGAEYVRVSCDSGTIRQNTWPCTVQEPCTHAALQQARRQAGPFWTDRDGPRRTRMHSDCACGRASARTTCSNTQLRTRRLCRITWKSVRFGPEKRQKRQQNVRVRQKYYKFVEGQNC